MDEKQVQAAAQLLWNTWQAGDTIEQLPQECQPQSPADGHAIQAALQEVTGRGILGWKLAATNETAQTYLGVDGPMAGRLFEGTLAEPSGTVSLAKNHMKAVEVEMAFRMEKTLPAQSAPYSQADVLAHVGGLIPAIEIPDSRYTEFTKVGKSQLVADDACACCFILGDEAPSSWREADLAAHEVRLMINGELAGEGTGANVLGDPRQALAWLANDLASRGHTLRAGEVIMTGTVVKPAAIQPGDHVVGDLGAFGSLEIRLS